MNKKHVFSLLLATFLIFGTSMAVSAQTSGNEQQLVGRWTSLHNSNISVTFNANGTMTGNIGFNIPGGRGNFAPTHWAAAGDKIVVLIPNSHRQLRGFRISDDGSTLIIVANVQGDNFEWWGTAFRRN